MASNSRFSEAPIPNLSRSPWHPAGESARNFFNSCSSVVGIQRRKSVAQSGAQSGWHVCAKWLLACILYCGRGSGKNTCVNLYGHPLAPESRRPYMWFYIYGSVAADCVCLLSADLSIRLTLTGWNDAKTDGATEKGEKEICPIPNLVTHQLKLAQALNGNGLGKLDTRMVKNKPTKSYCHHSLLSLNRFVGIQRENIFLYKM